MSSSRPHSGRTLFPFGTSRSGDDGYNTAFALLRAVPFTLRGPSDNRILHWGEPDLAARLLGIGEGDLPRTNSSLSDKLSDYTRKQREAAIKTLGYDGARYALIYTVLDESGETRWIEESAERIKGDGDMASHIIGVLKDVSKTRQTREEIAYELRHEPLTGFLTRDYFDDVLRHQQVVGHRPQLIKITLDNEDDLHAVYGPAAVEYLYKALASRISGELSPDDFSAFDVETGFALLFCRTGSEDILARSKKLKYILGNIPVESPFGVLVPDCQFAIETAPALPAIKTEKPEPKSAANRAFKRNEITELDIKLALEQNRFTLAYQPVVTSGVRRMAYYEGLLRYRSPEGKVETAFPYILAAERFGMIGQLDLRALQLAIADKSRRTGMKLALNLSAGTISDIDLKETYLQTLAQLGDETSDIIIELTETMAIETLQSANEFAARIQALGCGLAIDDFGTGHTSFQNLLGLEAETIKIDGSYVRDIAVDRQKQNFVRMMVEMSEVFGLKTVAEMVDNEADAKMCERLGATYLQGFYLGRPEALG